MLNSLKRPALGAAAAVALGVAALAGCSTTDGGGDTSGSDSGPVPGVTEDTITLGTLQALTGTFAAGAKAQLAGATLYWDDVNSSGGVCDGRSVELVARDHAYDPQKAVTAYSDIRNQILGIQLLTGTAMTEAVASKMEADTVSSIPMSWSPDLLGEAAILIPGTTYDVDMINAVDYLVSEGALSEGDTIGYIYFQGDFGGPGFEGASYAAEQHGISVDEYQVDPSVTDLSSQIRDIAGNDSKAIFMSTNPPLLANATGLSSTQGLDVPIVVPSPTFVPQLMDGDAAEQIAKRVLVVSPYNAWDADTEGMKDLRDKYEEAGDTEVPQQFYIAGYAAASLMHSALDAACDKGDLTRDALSEEFSNVTSFDMNTLSVDLSYADRSVPPSLADYIHKADTDAEGGLVPLTDTPFQGENAKPLLSGK